MAFSETTETFSDILFSRLACQAFSLVGFHLVANTPRLSVFILLFHALLLPSLERQAPLLPLAPHKAALPASGPAGRMFSPQYLSKQLLHRARFSPQPSLDKLVLLPGARWASRGHLWTVQDCASLKKAGVRSVRPEAAPPANASCTLKLTPGQRQGRRRTVRQGMLGLVRRGHSFSLCKCLLSLNWVNLENLVISASTLHCSFLAHQGPPVSYVPWGCEYQPEAREGGVRRVCGMDAPRPGPAG